ncbi:hypothetical protein [Tateyamaria pelophila]|uniref:hypothetical protein n=1 Tax=Tateyamaria pelophila TaxID=328415 RepID=UPI001CC0BB4F|nr:hypothetical protein [Tateyamaria pelophila]
MKYFPVIIAALTILCPGSAYAEWCDPPIAPELTTTELAKDFREEFKDEFTQYFRDASQYTACLDAERARIWEEMQFTVQRYERFLNDSKNWDGDE